MIIAFLYRSIFHLISLKYFHEEDEIGRACSMHGSRKKFIKKFGGKSCGKGTINVT
jgi:hypothetical protein